MNDRKIKNCNPFLIGLLIMIILRVFDFYLLNTGNDGMIMEFELIILPIILLISSLKFDYKEFFTFILGLLIVCLLVIISENIFSFPSLFVTYPKNDFAFFYGLSYLIFIFYDFIYIIILSVIFCVVKFIYNKVKKKG